MQRPEEGNRGYLLCKDDELEAFIDWNHPVVKHGLGTTMLLSPQRAVTVDRDMSAIIKGSAVLTTATGRMAVKGALSTRATAADSMQSTRMDIGMIGNKRPGIVM